MNTEVTEKNGHRIAVVQSDEIVMKDVQSALDFIMSVQYNSECSRIVLNKEAVAEDFFELRTRLAGEILQKFVTYQTKLAIYGDYSKYTSKALKDFIYESNNGNDIFFADDLQQAIEYIAAAQ